MSAHRWIRRRGKRIQDQGRASLVVGGLVVGEVRRLEGDGSWTGGWEAVTPLGLVNCNTRRSAKDWVLRAVMAPKTKARKVATAVWCERNGHGVEHYCANGRDSDGHVYPLGDSSEWRAVVGSGTLRVVVATFGQKAEAKRWVEQRSKVVG